MFEYVKFWMAKAVSEALVAVCIVLGLAALYFAVIGSCMAWGRWVRFRRKA